MNPLVSVSLITYNHKDFLEDAIESVLMQEVDFPYEIIIGDDCSDDGTQEIIREYEAKYPDTIFGIYHPRRYNEIPGRTNNMTNLYACRGKYIAMLDGDDYWTDHRKLQVQIDYLESHPEVALSFHDMLKNGHPLKSPYLFSENRKSLNRNKAFKQRDFFQGWFTPTSSIVFRNHISDELPEWFRQVYSADFALHLLTTNHGSIYYHHKVMGVKRFHGNSFVSSYAGSINGAKLRLNDARVFFKAFPKMNAFTALHRRRYGCFRDLSKLYWRKNRWKSIYYLVSALFLYPIVKFQRLNK